MWIEKWPDFWKIEWDDKKKDDKVESLTSPKETAKQIDGIRSAEAKSEMGDLLTNQWKCLWILNMIWVDDPVKFANSIRIIEPWTYESTFVKENWLDWLKTIALQNWKDCSASMCVSDINPVTNSNEWWPFICWYAIWDWKEIPFALNIDDINWYFWDNDVPEI